MNRAAWITVSLAFSFVIAARPQAAEIEPFEIGLTADRTLIEASIVRGGQISPSTIVLIGGLAGSDATGVAIEAALTAYAARDDDARPHTVIAIPVANPGGERLSFPPTGAAYRENTTAHYLWRRIGLLAPDLVIVVGEDNADLWLELTTNDVVGMGPLLARPISDPFSLTIPDQVGLSLARVRAVQRLARTPLEFASQLAPIYGQSFDPPIYITGMALLAHMGLGNIEHVEALVEPYVDGSADSLGGAFGTSSLTLAGHLVFAELAERTGDERYLERARAAADLAFDENGRMLEAMPAHGEMSDSIFMGASILAAVGHLSGESRYFDMAIRHIAFMNELVHRDDGLYRHSPLTDAAWGRGNGFAAIGHALTLSWLPTDHPAFDQLRDDYVAYMRTLAAWQNDDGSWRQVIDVPGAYHETSSTAIIGFSMQRGLNRGWLDPAEFSDTVSNAWQAVLRRTDQEGGFIDVSESTNKQPSLDAYLDREALFGPDPRTGSFAMLFAVERAASAEDE